MIIGKDYCEDNFDKSFDDAIGSLSQEYPFSVLNYNFNKHDIECLDNLNINVTSEYNNYGSLKNLDQGIREFIFSLGNNQSESECTSITIQDFITNVLTSAKKDSAWVTLRASTPNSLFDTPRWHMDGKYYSFDSDELQYKIVISFKGPSTLFYPLAVEEREEFQAILSQNLELAKNEDGSMNREKLYEISEQNRKILAAKLDLSKAISLGAKQAAIFVVGSDFASIHSEPPVKEPRLFLSILPGTKEQIEELKIRWKV